MHGPDSVYTFAPRLALAWDQRHNEIVMAERHLHRLGRELESLERLVVHRDLQFLRASGLPPQRASQRNRDRYARHRADKLEHAQQRHAATVAEIAAWQAVLDGHGEMTRPARRAA
jgi:hypothetical protein